MKIHRGNKKLSKDFAMQGQIQRTSQLNSKLNLGLSKTQWAFALIILTLAFFVSSGQAQEWSLEEDEQKKDYYDPGIDSFEDILNNLPDEANNYFDPVKKKALLDKFGKGAFFVTIDSIEPEGGPISGNTRVLVRGGPLQDLEILFPHPKCKFGKYDLVVDATYVKCTTAQTAIEDTEPRHNQRNETCLQCDNSPETTTAEIVPFQVSLKGDFSDSINSVPYRYYSPTRVWAIEPRYGPKDGATYVQVWGENFLNFDENTRCNFGSKSVVAHYVNGNYLTCLAPFSDVVEKPIPFSVSLNKQQNSKDSVNFWYYNWPQVTELVPNYGPDSGGNRVIIKGNNFNPFAGEDIDNSNDTFCEFEGIGKVKAYILNSTKLYCEAPPNFVLENTIVEVTLNNQQYTDDNVPYYYYRPPQVFDVDPREGPTKGGTEVTVFGNKFKEGKNITCKFGDKVTKGTFVDTNRIICVSPQVERPGYVPLVISYEGEKYSSETVKFLYYETPEFFNITPTCGPVSGYTQITIFGKNFIDMGFGKVKCIFNNTYYMNATIMESDIIKCDSPPLPEGEFEGTPWFNISVTLNEKDIGDTHSKFNYYIDPEIKTITPNVGPLKGGTISKLAGKGFAQEGVCNVTVRYGASQQKLINYTDTELVIVSPPAEVPDAVVVSVALNGQQFVKDKTLHYRDFENTFTYIQDFFIQEYNPHSGPTSGKTKITVKGLGFNQFKEEDGSGKAKPLYVRFRDMVTGEQIAEPTEAFNVLEDEFSWKTPAANQDTNAIMEISYNKQDWTQVLAPGQNYSYQYYTAPKIGYITPNYGPVKSPENETIEIVGSNFACPDADCKDLWVRFGTPENGILVKGEKISNDRIKVQVPKYTKPDVLPVEVTFNGQDYTHDNQTYGFFDPYILDITPKLISIKGTTRVRLHGFGFVNASSELKTNLSHLTRGGLSCSGSNCIQYAEYIDPSTIETPTFPQSYVKYSDTGDNIGFDGMVIEASVVANSWTQNKLQIWYYANPTYKQPNINGTAGNHEKPIFIPANFNWGENDFDKFNKFGNFSCRFTSSDGKKVVYTKGKLEFYPLGNHDEEEKPNHIKCNSPIWKTADNVKLDVSINGFDYEGNFPFQFYDTLDVYRIAPLAGPNEGSTRVKLFGSGFISGSEDVHVKFGIIETQKMIKDQILDYIWNENDFVTNTMVQGSEILLAYKKEAYNIKKVDEELTDNTRLKTYVVKSPKLSNWNQTHGGPLYLAVGENFVINTTTTNFTFGEDSNLTVSHVNSTYYYYQQSSVEYYYYQQPVVKKVEPKSGLVRGGTKIEISGAWFAYKPEYGVVPHCKIGDKVSRAIFSSTVRIVCRTPPNDDINQLFPVSVSLNGVDFVDTGFTFRYYEQPILYKMTPITGPESGGTQIYITGNKFSNISDPQNFNCRFTSTERDVPAKYIPAFYENQTTIMCSSPGGWGRGDTVKVQVTFNGEDYSENNFTFYYYNIVRAYPRSGPSDGTGGPIKIEGSGFRNDTEIYCSLDKVLYEPLEVKPDLIKCPMMKNKNGNSYFGNVDFAVIIDGNWHKFTGGFQYYEQIDMEDIYPKIGPAEGKGVILIYGKNFRDDFQLADVGCKVGDSVGKGKVINANTINCTVEDMALVDEGYTLPVTVSLNSYSWVESNATFVPYGVTAVYPNSGPYTGNTDILISGKGFNEELQEKAKCRFGINADYAIVDAEILSYDKLICRSPAEFKLPPTADQTISVPIGVGFLDEEFNPWTETIHRFRFYTQPGLARVEPDEVDIGKMAEVYVFADENSEFWEPIPTSKGALGQYGIECKFGRFGIGMGMYVNRTTIKCVTPSVSDDPDSIWRETVKLTVALNGQDFNDENSDVDFTFVGRGSTLVFWPYVIGTLLIGLLLIALIVFCSALLQKFSWEKISSEQRRSGRKRDNKAYVIRDPYNQFTSRAYSAGQLGGADPSGQQERKQGSY